jgi:hypothetical protein
VTSSPEGATVLLDGVPSGKTPCFVSVPLEHAGVLTFELAEHEAAVVRIGHSINGKTWLNLLWIAAILPMGVLIHDIEEDSSSGEAAAAAAGIAGVGLLASFAVDAGTGNIRRHSGDPIHAVLTRKSAR